jgi:hypothetical protein
MITPPGQKTVFVAGFTSVINQGSIEGISKLLYHNGKLYFMHGFNAKLYIANVSSFKSGDASVNLADIHSYDIGAFVKKQGYTDPLNSNPFELAFGPDNNLYIADAGGNVIIKRDQASGDLSEFALIPKTAEGKEAVPTGIVYDGSKFLVSTLTGFPFSRGEVTIFQMPPPALSASTIILISGHCQALRFQLIISRSWSSMAHSGWDSQLEPAK